MQGAFVLCRLFHKPEEKADVLKYDEVEQTGLSPTTTKSSPDETSSDVVQETATSDMQGEKQSESIMRWWNDKSDNMSPDALPPVPGDSYMASDVEDPGAEETGIQVRFQFFVVFVVTTVILFLITLHNFIDMNNSVTKYCGFVLLNCRGIS